MTLACKCTCGKSGNGFCLPSIKDCEQRLKENPNHIVKNSEILRQKFEEEDNDLKALAIANKILREERMERVKERWIEKIVSSPKIIKHESTDNKYTFWMEDGNIIDFYPKANKLLIRKQNKWFKPALNWLIRKLELE